MQNLLCVSLCITGKDEIGLIWYIIIIISLISIFVLDVFNILFFISQYNLKNIALFSIYYKRLLNRKYWGSTLFFGFFLLLFLIL